MAPWPWVPWPIFDSWSMTFWTHETRKLRILFLYNESWKCYDLDVVAGVSFVPMIVAVMSRALLELYIHPIVFVVIWCSVMNCYEIPNGSTEDEPISIIIL